MTCSVCGSESVVRLPAGERYTPYGMVALAELCCTECGDVTRRVVNPNDLQKLIDYANDPGHEDVIWLQSDKRKGPFR